MQDQDQRTYKHVKSEVEKNKQVRETLALKTETHLIDIT